MGHSFEVDRDQNLVSVVYDESSTLDDRINVLEKIIQLLKVTPRANIFIDATIANNNLSFEEQKQFSEMLVGNLKYFKLNRTAILNPRNIHTAITTLAYLNGHQHVALFEDKAEALQWVRGEIN